MKKVFKVKQEMKALGGKINHYCVLFDRNGYQTNFALPYLEAYRLSQALKLEGYEIEFFNE